jgi:hypothetical protein
MLRTFKTLSTVDLPLSISIFVVSMAFDRVIRFNRRKR